jgi:hypothetical protein
MRMNLSLPADNAAKFADVRAFGQGDTAPLLLELLTGPWARLS